MKKLLLFVLLAVAPCFSQQVKSQLVIRVSGHGNVRSLPGHIDCPWQCSQFYYGYQDVKLEALPAHGWKFKEWGEVCSGTGKTTDIRLAGLDVLCTARFEKKP